MSTSNKGYGIDSRLQNLTNALYIDSNNDIVLRIGEGSGVSNYVLPVATTTTLGGIKVGPGVHVTSDGVLTVDTSGLPLNIGDFYFSTNNMGVVNSNENLNILSNGTGKVNLVGQLNVHTTAQWALSDDTGIPAFTIDSAGEVRIVVAVPNQYDGAFNISGNSDGSYLLPQNFGVMEQITGQPTIPSRIYNDGQDAYAAYVGRRYDGSTASPTKVLNTEIISRIGATPYTDEGWPGISSARIDFVATQDQNLSTNSIGNNIQFWTTPQGSSTIGLSATIDSTGVITPKITFTNGASIGTNSDTNIEVYGNLLPNGTNFNLGSTTNYWANAYFGPHSLNILPQIPGGTTIVIKNEQDILEVQAGGFAVFDPTGTFYTLQVDPLTGETFVRTPSTPIGKAVLNVSAYTNTTFIPLRGTAAGGVAHFTGPSDGPTTITMDNFDDSLPANLGNAIVWRRFRGTPDAPTAVQANDILGFLAAAGYGDGPTYTTAGY